MSRICLFVMVLALLLGPLVGFANLSVKVDDPKQIGQKAIIKLTLKNTFTEKIESARAQVFLLDDNGKVVGQAVRWVIGGTKDKPALAPDAETTINFLVPSNKPFRTSKVSFTRVILEGGKLADVTKDVSVIPAAK